MDSKRSSSPGMTMLRVSRGKLESSMCLTRQAVVCATTARQRTELGEFCALERFEPSMEVRNLQARYFGDWPV
jgi:hypothetical protein